MKKINEMLKLLRVSKSLTQKEVSKILNIKQYNLSDYETGRAFPPLDILIQLADLYEISLDDLCQRDVERIKSFNDTSTNPSEYLDLHTLKIVRRIENLTIDEKENLYSIIDPMIKNIYKK